MITATYNGVKVEVASVQRDANRQRTLASIYALEGQPFVRYTMGGPMATEHQTVSVHRLENVKRE